MAAILIFLAALTPGFSKKVTPLAGLLNPEKMIVNYDKIFVTQGVEIFVYSCKDFKLLARFGEAGEGPREFKITPPDQPLDIHVSPEDIQVNSVFKVSFFTHKGEFIREHIPPNPHWRNFQPLGRNFVYETFLNVDGTYYRAFSLCGPDFSEIKNIYRQKHILQSDKFTLGKEVPKFQVVNDKIFVSGKEGFTIDIFSGNGDLLKTVEQPYEKRKITDKDKKEIMEFLKIKYRQLFQEYGELIRFAPDFPAIGDFTYSEPYLYVSTNKEKDKKQEFYIFDGDGNLVKILYLPLAKQNPFQLYPYGFYKGKAYQLIENEDTEGTDLYIFDMGIQ
jgi:hypothetical protein